MTLLLSHSLLVVESAASNVYHCKNMIMVVKIKLFFWESKLLGNKSLMSHDYSV